MIEVKPLSVRCSVCGVEEPFLVTNAVAAARHWDMLSRAIVQDFQTRHWTDYPACAEVVPEPVTAKVRGWRWWPKVAVSR